MVKTVLFDFDGTLVDSLPFIRLTYERVFNIMGLDWANGEVMRWIGVTLKEIAVRFAGEERADEFINIYRRLYAANQDKCTRLFPKTKGMLAELKEAGYKLGIVTSKNGQVTERSVKHMGVDKYFDTIVGAEAVTRHKPHPEPVLKGAANCGSIPRETVYIGDSPFDILSGKAAGCWTVGVSWGMASVDELLALQPDLVIDNWNQLNEWLKSRCQEIV